MSSTTEVQPALGRITVCWRCFWVDLNTDRKPYVWTLQRGLHTRQTRQLDFSLLFFLISALFSNQLLASNRSEDSPGCSFYVMQTPHFHFPVCDDGAFFCHSTHKTVATNNEGHKKKKKNKRPQLWKRNAAHQKYTLSSFLLSGCRKGYRGGKREVWEDKKK